MFNLKKGGLLVAQVTLTLLNYILWAVVLKPLGMLETASSMSVAGGKLMGQAAPTNVANTAAGITASYGLVKTLVYLGTTGLMVLILKKNNAHENISHGRAVLGVTVAALVVDMLNMTILPSAPLYALATLLIVLSKEKEV